MAINNNANGNGNGKGRFVFDAKSNTGTKEISVKGAGWTDSVQLQLTLDFTGVSQAQMADWAFRTLAINVQQILRGRDEEFVRGLAKTGLRKNAAESMVVGNAKVSTEAIIGKAKSMTPEELQRLINELQRQALGQAN